MNNKVAGKYFGTEIDSKWWKRYKKNNLFARGNGDFSYDEFSISFLRLLTVSPIIIELEKILEIKVGKWHCGQWGAGKPILKILWKQNNQLLSSGFSVSKENGGVEGLLPELSKHLHFENLPKP